ncbi:hypothetical protein [Rhodococcus erythropolis]|uniref:Uncharacterized protein n=1 Tax=Rhodococcus erythropolis TaxID=1833 RepID=A0A8I1A0B6_RHOER|nr:hypothetical protein [Rhodococcus erythropolis]MBH5146332.1 hypothetical protein [Rhodococcus erythropolis]
MSDSKPYRSVTPIKNGDRIAFVCGDQRVEGTAQVESGPLAREQNIRIIPDGEPWKYGRDCAFAESDPIWVNPFLSDATELHAAAVKRFVHTQLHELGLLGVWALPEDPFDADAWKAYHSGAVPGGRKPAWMVDVGLAEPEPETPQQRALPRPSTTPPPWADNPAGQRRPTKTPNHRRVK